MPVFYSTFDVVITILRLIVISIGIFGNIISFIVFSRRIFRNNSISTYCRALAIINCLSIIELIKDIWRFFHNKEIFNVNDFTCKSFFYVSLLFNAIPGWILVAFSIDKMLNMKTSPPNILKSKLFQWSIVAAIILFHLIFYIEVPISLNIEYISFTPEKFVCNFPFISFFEIRVYAIIIESCVIPFVIMIISSFVTIRILIRSRRYLEGIGNSGNSAKPKRIREIKYAISSVTLNFLFIIFKSPFLIFPLLPLDGYNKSLAEISLFFLLFDCSIMFFIHLATNSIFRREFFVIFEQTF